MTLFDSWLMPFAYLGAALYLLVFPVGLGFLIWHQIDKWRPYAATATMPDPYPEPAPEPLPARRSPFRRVGGAR